jgi:hypothetical protein
VNAGALARGAAFQKDVDRALTAVGHRAQETPRIRPDGVNAALQGLRGLGRRKAAFELIRSDDDDGAHEIFTRAREQCAR